MRTICTVAALMVCAGALAAQDKMFASKEGKYTAVFPGEPKTINQDAGGLKLSITIFERDKDKDKHGFAVIYSDLAPDVIKAAPPAKLLENGELGLAKDFKAKVTKASETKFKSGGKEYPAREIMAEKEDKHMRVMLVIADNRLFQVLVIGSKDFVSSPEADAFIKSFTLDAPKTP